MNAAIQSLIARAVNYLRRWTGGSDSATGETLPGLTALRPKDWNRFLVTLRTAIIVLLVIQGLRSGAALLHTSYLLSAMDVSEAEVSRPKKQDESEKYEAILEKGVLGKPPPMQPVQLFGVLGNMALIGNSPEQVKEYAVGAEIPGGEKLVRIGVEDVELEKEGKKRTLTVFPELKKR